MILSTTEAIIEIAVFGLTNTSIPEVSMSDDIAALTDSGIGLHSRAAFCVIVPAYNEATGLAEFHRRLSTVMESLARPWNVLYVNDGNTDDTLNVLRSLRT
jgi:hypothetical protein